MEWDDIWQDRTLVWSQLPSNIVLDRDPPRSPQKGRSGVGTLSSQRCRLSPNYFGRCCSAIDSRPMYFTSYMHWPSCDPSLFCVWPNMLLPLTTDTHNVIKTLVDISSSVRTITRWCEISRRISGPTAVKTVNIRKRRSLSATHHDDVISAVIGRRMHRNAQCNFPSKNQWIILPKSQHSYRMFLLRNFMHTLFIQLTDWLAYTAVRHTFFSDSLPAENSLFLFHHSIECKIKIIVWL